MAVSPPWVSNKLLRHSHSMWSYPYLSVSAPLLDQAPSGQIGVLWSVLMNPCDGCHRLCRGPAGQPDRSAELAIKACLRPWLWAACAGQPSFFFFPVCCCNPVGVVGNDLRRTPYALLSMVHASSFAAPALWCPVAANLWPLIRWW